VGLAAAEALPVLLDGDHYIHMKMLLHLAKATLSAELSFICISFLLTSSIPDYYCC
jgi:hypothetical protein